MPREALNARIRPLPASPSSAVALERLREAAARQGAEHLLGGLLADPRVADFLGSALGDCPYLLDLAARDVGRLADILGEAPQDRAERQIAALGAGWPGRAETMAGLRRAKQDIALALGLADLAAAIDLETVTGLLTGFADAAVGAALRFALSEAARTGKWQGGELARGFILLAMGKAGAHELNYSSDIDLIALYEAHADDLGDGVEPGGFWVRIVRAMVALLQERTADGYVFRIDLRLRPDAGATPVALSAAGALAYYESMGQNWERAALIKARAAAGDIAAGERFLRELKPYIWRKYLDFAAIADIHAIKRQVHAHRGHGEVQVLGHDIKRGRGGIREIEFFVQTQQLIAGGRDRSLRGRATREMLARLAEAGWIDEAARSELDEAYVFLRRLEHRLQMVADEQTHTMPRDPAGLARIARLMGHASPGDFEAKVRSVLAGVAQRSSELFEEAPALSGDTGSLVFTGGEDDPETIRTIARLGFREPPTVTDTVRGWHFGRVAAMRSTAAREGLTEIIPALLQAFARTGNPDATLRAFDGLLRALPAGAQLFSLLSRNRELLDVLAGVLGAAPRLAEIFGRRPHVVDALIDPAAVGEADDMETVEARLAARLADAAGYEDALDRVRLFAAEQRFLVAVGLLQQRLSAEAAGRHFSDIAECVARALFQRTCGEFERRHGCFLRGASALIAFGRLGSREMTFGSDLDLMVIYDLPPGDAGSDGQKPLPAGQYYTRLTQRLVAALAAPTAEGSAYEVDLRLRPSGNAGPLATSLAAFEHYQLNDAWTWEHMAMSRGRVIAGEASFAARVAGVLDRIVAMPRDRTKLAADVADMRTRLDRDKPAAGKLDVKLAKGGLIDCEFAAQFLALSGLGRSFGETTGDILQRAVSAGRIPGQAGRAFIEGGHLQTAILQLLRIGDAPADPDALPDAMKRLLVSGDMSFETWMARLSEAQQQVRASLSSLLGQTISS